MPIFSSHGVKPPKLEFKKDNRYFKFVGFNNETKRYMYEVKLGNITYYEVFNEVVITAKYDRTLKEVVPTEPHAKYPKDENFGNWAWCYSGFNAIEKATEKMNNNI